VKGRFAAAGALALVLAAGACTEEGPTDVGSGLVAGGELRTFEVVLESGMFLALDTAFAGYTTPAGIGYQIVAHEFDGVLDAHALTRFVSLPDSQQVAQTGGGTVWDSDLSYIGGQLTAAVDTLRSVADGQVEVELRRILQPWDPASATWTLAVDSGAISTPWEEPGGTRSGPVSGRAWAAGQDSLLLPLDSITAEALAAASDDEQGLLLSMTGGEGRLRIQNMSLRVDIRPSTRPDTVIRVQVPVTRRTSVYTPRLAAAASLPRVGGIEAWRAFLRFAPDLEDLIVPCGPADANPACTVRLGDAVLNRAELLLEPVAPPAGFTPTDSVPITASTVLRPPLVPLARSPLATVVGVVGAISPTAFRAGADTTVVVDITSFMRPLAAGGQEAADATPWLALFSPPEGSRFGVGAFSDTPRLRLVLTVATEVQLR
jgi:hypothetical protein